MLTAEWSPKPPAARQSLSAILGAWIMGHRNYRYSCPKCGAPLSQMELADGGLLPKGDKIFSKMGINCKACGRRHLARPEGNRAVHVFMSLRGTKKIKRKLKATIRQIVEGVVMAKCVCGKELMETKDGFRPCPKCIMKAHEAGRAAVRRLIVKHVKSERWKDWDE